MTNEVCRTLVLVPDGSFVLETNVARVGPPELHLGRFLAVIINICVCISKRVSKTVAHFSSCLFPKLLQKLSQHASLVWYPSAYATHVREEVSSTWSYPPLSVLDEGEGR
jgi:hypothetical protein